MTSEITIIRFLMIVLLSSISFQNQAQIIRGFGARISDGETPVPVTGGKINIGISKNGKIIGRVQSTITDKNGRFSLPSLEYDLDSKIIVTIVKEGFKDTTLSLLAKDIYMPEQMFSIFQKVRKEQVLAEEKSLAKNNLLLNQKFDIIQNILANEKIKADKKLKREVEAFQAKKRGYEAAITKLKSEKDILNNQLADSLRSFNVRIIRMFDEFSELQAKVNYYLENLETFNVKIAGFQIQDGAQTPLRKQKQLKMKFFLEKVSKDFKVSKKPFKFKIRVQQILGVKERRKDIGEDDFMYDAETMSTEKVIDMASGEMSFYFDWVCNASKDQFFDDDRHYLVFLTNITNPDYILPLGHAQIFNGNRVTFYQEPNQDANNPNLDKTILEDQNITLCENKMELEIANRVNFSDSDVVEIYVRGERSVHSITLKNSNAKYTFDLELGDNPIEVLVKNKYGKVSPMNKFKKVNFLIKFKGDCVQEEYEKGKEIEIFPDQKWGVKVTRLK